MAREFWIQHRFTIDTFPEINLYSAWEDERVGTIHVIEKSAYDAASEAYEEIIRRHSGDVNLLFTDIRKLEAKLDIAIFALEKLAGRGLLNGPAPVAEEALAKIRAIE